MNQAFLSLRRFLVVVTLLTWSANPFVTVSNAAEPHCLWKVQGPKTTVHLLGSLHVLKKEHYPMPAPMEKAFEGAQVVCFETDIAQMEQPKNQQSLLTKAQLPAGQTLAGQITKETYAKLSAHLKEVGVPAITFDRFRPWFVAVGLLALELPKLGLDPEYGLDKHYYERAKKAGKTIQPLETVEFQVSLLSELSKEDDQAFLESTLKDIKNVRTMLNDLIGAWQKGDAAKLDKMLHEALAEYPSIHRRLLLDRNKRWTDELEKLAKGDKPALVVVGAGHLVGKESVVDLLEKRGFKVVQE